MLPSLLDVMVPYCKMFSSLIKQPPKSLLFKVVFATFLHGPLQLATTVFRAFVCLGFLCKYHCMEYIYHTRDNMQHHPKLPTKYSNKTKICENIPPSP